MLAITSESWCDITFVLDGYYKIVGVAFDLDDRTKLYDQTTLVGKNVNKQIRKHHNLPSNIVITDDKLTTILSQRKRLNIYRGTSTSKYAYSFSFKRDEHANSINLPDRTFLVMINVTEQFVNNALDNPTHPLYEELNTIRKADGVMINSRPYVKYHKLIVL